MTFVIWKSKKDCKWYWHLKAANGEVIAHGQGYKYKRDAQNCVNMLHSGGVRAASIHTYAAESTYHGA